LFYCLHAKKSTGRFRQIICGLRMCILVNISPLL
jgi:hypothetical protein